MTEPSPKVSPTVRDPVCTTIALGIAALVVLRLVAAATMKLTFDEAYYWLWSKHLAAGYFDHPPLVAVVIRLGTVMAGDTELGVRLVSVLLALPASWAVWRTAAILFRDARLAATAALFFNLTLIEEAASVIVTPDSPLIVAGAFVLLFLVKAEATDRGIWWLATGAAVGAALLSKYTAVFFGIGIVAWLLIAPDMRRWLRTPWPWLGGLIAAAMFLPVVLWNAGHDWISFVFQTQRLGAEHWTPLYLGDYLAGQIGLATPAIFILGACGLAAFLRGRGGTRSGRILLSVMVWPLALTLGWQSLHGHVQGNWATPIYPAFSIAAAAAAYGVGWSRGWRRLIDWSHRLAVPIAAGTALILGIQAVFGIITLHGKDPTARQLAIGWPELGGEIDALRQNVGAGAILTTNYALTGWLAFYLPSHPPIVQLNERFRWTNEPEPAPALLAGPLLYVCRMGAAEAGPIRKAYSSVDAIAHMTRQRYGLAIESYTIYRVAGPFGDPLDPAPLADMLARRRDEALHRRGTTPETC